MWWDSSSASAVTASTLSSDVRRRLPARSMIRVVLSAENETGALAENGSCLFVTESTAIARVDCGSLNKTGAGVCADVFGKRVATAIESSNRAANEHTEREKIRLPMLVFDQSLNESHANSAHNLSLNAAQWRCFCASCTPV